MLTISKVLVFATILVQSCTALVMRDPTSGAEVASFASPVLSRFVGLSQEACSSSFNATGLEAFAVPVDKDLCNPPTAQDIIAYNDKLLVVPDVFRVNPGKCTPEQMLRNVAASGAKGIVSVVSRKIPGNTIVYKGSGEPSNEGTIPFLTAGKGFMTNVSFDFKTRNMSTSFVFDITCDTSEYEVSVYYIGPILFTLLGLFAFRTSFIAMKSILQFRKSGSLQVSQTAILFVLFFMNFADGIVLVFGIAGYTTNSWILGNENITYGIKQVFSNVFMGFGLLATLWTGIFWSLLQEQTSKMSNKGSPNIFKQAPIRTTLALLCAVPMEMYMSFASATWDTSLAPIYAPVIMLVSIGAGLYFYRKVSKFFKLTGYNSKTSKTNAEPSKRKSSATSSRRESAKPNIPHFIIILARALKRFSMFLLYQMIATLLVESFQLNTNPWGQNFSSFIYATGTFGMAYYLVQGLAPSKKVNKSRTTGNSRATSRLGSSSIAQNTMAGDEGSIVAQSVAQAK